MSSVSLGSVSLSSIGSNTSTDSGDMEYKKKLMTTVKREVKQIMEEAVTRKFINEDSSSIISLCAAVEACLSHGLKRRALGLFKSSSTTALVQKVAKANEAADRVCHLLEDMEKQESAWKRSTTAGSEFSLYRTRSFTKNQSPPAGGSVSGSPGGSPFSPTRYLWIRLALLEKLLPAIVDHLVENANKYYEKEAFLADSELGPILSSLLVGPCALDISKLKTTDHYFSDPPADELVQRHKISCISPQTPPSGRRPLQYRRPLSAEDPQCHSPRSGVPFQAKDYVESLHQNNKVTLLYGKNNVIVHPRSDVDPLPGYLSLHQNSRGSLFVKWTPNQLMNGGVEDEKDKSAFWELALNLKVDDLVYLHCHQAGPDAGGTLIFVGQDGVPRPSIQFPPGGHLLSFLSCFETGLLPKGHLDPPLWSQRGKGKVFPCLKRRSVYSVQPLIPAGSVSEPGRDQDSEMDCAEDGSRPSDDGPGADVIRENELAVEPDSPEGNGMQHQALDFVFRILFLHKPPEWPPKSPPHRKLILTTSSSSSTGSVTPLIAPPCTPDTTRTSSTSTSHGLSLPDVGDRSATPISPLALYSHEDGAERGEESHSIQQVCDTMKRQIISRAFYGWLAHCRHLRTVRTHLSGLVHCEGQHTIVPTKEDKVGLTKELWHSFQTESGSIKDWEHVTRMIYYGGMTHTLRATVWPFLLGYYSPNSTSAERTSRNEVMKTKFEKHMEEWKALEVIVRRREEEAVTRARFSSTTSSASSSPSATGAPGSGGGGSFNKWGDTIVRNNTDTESTSLSSSRETPLEQAKSMSNEVFESLETNTIESTETMVSETHGGKVEGMVVEGNGVVRGDEECEGEQEMDSEEDRSSEEKESTVATVPRSAVVASGEAGYGGSPNKTARDVPMIRAAMKRRFYSRRLLDVFGMNLHRIDKDVNRCDRNHPFFNAENLNKLRNIMCTYVWNHLDIGYMQGMCDLVAPLLVILEDESLTFGCFCRLMERMGANFPNGGAMDRHLANLRSLIQILDSELFDLLDHNKECTHFFFCYRWFLLDFKRELLYDDIFAVWEVIWAAQKVASTEFVLFIALALVQYYREIILDNSMDFTDIIKFFNEMAERHDASAILKFARELVLQLQNLIDNT